MKRRDWVGTYVAIVITTVWASTIVIGMINQHYQPPTAIYPALLGVVGGVFGYRFIKPTISIEQQEDAEIVVPKKRSKKEEEQ